ncbi:unnamed protein product [Urochloa humidicola]
MRCVGSLNGAVLQEASLVLVDREMRIPAVECHEVRHSRGGEAVKIGGRSFDMAELCAELQKAGRPLMELSYVQAALLNPPFCGGVPRHEGTFSGPQFTVASSYCSCLIWLTGVNDQMRRLVPKGEISRA